MVLAAPEFVITKRIELLDQVEIPAELQHRVLADRVMRREEGSKFETSHGVFLRTVLLGCPTNYGVAKTKAIAYSGPCCDGRAAIKSAALRRVGEFTPPAPSAKRTPSFSSPRSVCI